MKDFLKIIRGWFVHQEPGDTRLNYAPDSVFDMFDALEQVLKAGSTDRPALTKHLAQSMQGMTPREWVHLATYRGYTRLPIAAVSVLAGFAPDESVELLGVASLNRDGFVRQAALRQLGGLAHPRAVPYVLLRLGDWVSEVRAEAERALRLLMRAGIVEPFVEHHLLIERLLRVRRVCLEAIRMEILAHLHDLRFRNRLCQILEYGPHDQRLFVLSVLEGRLLGEPGLLEKIATTGASLVRARAASLILQTDQVRYRDLIQGLLRDRSPWVQMMVLQWIEPQVAVQMQAYIQERMFEDSPAVRSAARFVLERQGVTDLVGLYRERIAKDSQEQARPGWVAGLGETGDAQDLVTLSAFLNARRSKVRTAALEAIARINPEAAIEPAIAALRDEAGGARRVAVNILRAHLDERVLAAARDLLESGEEAGQRAALHLLVSLPGWDPVPDILAALLARSERVRDQAWAQMREWCRVYFGAGWIGPDRATQERLQRVIRQLDSAKVEPPKEYAKTYRNLLALIART